MCYFYKYFYFYLFLIIFLIFLYVNSFLWFSIYFLVCLIVNYFGPMDSLSLSWSRIMKNKNLHALYSFPLMSHFDVILRTNKRPKYCNNSKRFWWRWNYLMVCVIVNKVHGQTASDFCAWSELGNLVTSRHLFTSGPAKSCQYHWLVLSFVHAQNMAAVQPCTKYARYV